MRTATAVLVAACTLGASDASALTAALLAAASLAPAAAPEAAATQELVLTSGERIAVTELARSEGKVRFRTAEGQVRQVPESEVASPALADIPQLLRLRSGENLLVKRIARSLGRVRFETFAGEVRQVPEADVASPALDQIPQLLRLTSGETIEVLRLARKDGKVRFQTVGGAVRQVAEADVASPPVVTIALLGAGGELTLPPPPPVVTAEAQPEPPAGPVPFPPAPVPAPRQFGIQSKVMASRWDILDLLPPDKRLVRGKRSDPYNQNPWKGDKPIAGDSLFLVLTGVLDTPTEYRRLPLPSGVSAENAGSLEFFGDGSQVFLSPRALLSVELFRGQTVFRPKSWALKVTAAGNLNYLSAQERNAVHIDPREGAQRFRQDVSLEEASFEIKLADLSKNFDTVSLRAGIQPFVSDFRGFVFVDQNLGARLFGNLGANRWQYNLAAFDLLEKQTNSELNTFEMRDHQVYVANLYRQDFLRHGYTMQFSVHVSRDDASEEEHYDANGFLVRPARIGSPRLKDVHANYLGFAGDGHLGGLNVSHAIYYASGTDEDHPLGRRFDAKQDIQAFLGALELSVDKDWVRPKLTAFFASGDDDGEDGKAKGFDSIYDGVNFAGGAFSFWNRSGIPLTQTSVLLKTPGSLLPNLRSNKFEGQANFVNPGLLLLGAGADLDLTPRLRGVLNVNYLRFHRTGVLSQLLFQPDIRKDIGIDWGVGVLYRPLLNENVVISAGVTGLLPMGAMEDLFASPGCEVGGCGASERTLLNAFLQFKLTY